MKYGLIGVHRSGKTTLAEAVSLETDLPLVITRVSDIIKSKGLTLTVGMTLGERIDVQQAILKESCEQWAAESSFITDRTPIDMLGYTLAEVTNSTKMSRREEQALVDYINACFDALNANFHGVMFVPRALPIKPAGDKEVASTNLAYVEGLGMLMMGAAVDPRNQVPVSYLDKQALAIDLRVSAVVSMIEALRGRYNRMSLGAVRH